MANSGKNWLECAACGAAGGKCRESGSVPTMLTMRARHADLVFADVELASILAAINCKLRVMEVFEQQDTPEADLLREIEENIKDADLAHVSR